MTYNKHDSEAKATDVNLLSRPRPLSPHIAVFKAEYSSMFSIFHRISGVVLSLLFLFFGLFTRVLVYNSIELSAVVDLVQFSAGSFILIYFVESLIIVVFVFSLVYHFSNGLRHLCWDLGFGVNKELIEKTALYVLGLTVILTLVLLFVFFS